MAGTGHSYEIANVETFDMTLEAAATRLPEGPGRRWFRSRSVRRALSAPDLVTTIDRRGVLAYAAANGMDRPTRDRLVGKADDGAVRFFSPLALRGRGIDLDHVADWIRDRLADPASGERFAKSLPRVTVADAVAMAEKASHAARKGATAAAASILPVCQGNGGRQWVELANDEALTLEAEAMHHCVGNAGYLAGLGRGFRFFSLRDPGGWPKLTVQAVVRGTSVSIPQAKGFANSIGYVEFKGDVVALATALETQGLRIEANGSDERDLGSMDLVPAGGTLREREDLFGAVTIGGVACSAHGMEARFAVDGRPVAIRASRPGWWLTSEERHYGLSVDFYGRDGYEARRIAARILDGYGATRFQSDSDGIVMTPEGSWKPWEDTDERRVVEDLTCRVLERETRVMLPGSGATATFAKKENSREGHAMSFSRMPNDDDLRMLVRYLAGMGAPVVDEPTCRVAGRVRKRGLRKAMAGPWHFMPDVERREPEPKGGTWVLTPWSAELVRDGRTAFAVSFDEGRAVLHASCDAAPDVLEAAARTMTRLKLADVGRTGDWWRRFPERPGTKRFLAHDGRRWFVAGPRSDLAGRARKVPENERVPPTLARIVAATKGEDPRARDAYLRCAVDWLAFSGAMPEWSAKPDPVFGLLAAVVADLGSLPKPTATRFAAYLAEKPFGWWSGYGIYGDAASARLLAIWLVAATAGHLKASATRTLLAKAVGGRRAPYMHGIRHRSFEWIRGGRAAMIDTILGALEGDAYGKRAERVRAVIANLLENDLRHVMYGTGAETTDPAAIEGSSQLLKLRSARSWASSWEADEAERKATELEGRGEAVLATLVRELRAFAAATRERLAAAAEERERWLASFRKAA